ncbi:MAG: sulfatase family protein [bacterium]
MNVIVIVTDSLRWDYVGCYGGKPKANFKSDVRTPNIDRLASEGTLFEYAYSEGLPTLPTRTAWFTGRYTFPFRGWQPFERDDILLAEVLWDKGYTSALITDTYHMHKPQYNCGRGFDYVRFIRGQEYDPYIVDPKIKVDVDRYYKDDGKGTWPKERLEQYLKNISGRRGEEDHFVAQVVKAGIEWLEEQSKIRKDKIFLWLDCFDPHEPWDPPAEYTETYDPGYRGKEIIDPVPTLVEGYLTEEELNHIKALYAGEVTLVDKWVGIFLDSVRDLGLFDNSLIVHISDHGEPFGDHGIIRKCRPWLYEEQVRIPFILRHPEGLGRGKRISAIVETCDLMPTVLDFLKIQGPDCMHGRSVLPLLTGEEEKLRDYAYIGWHGRSWAIKNREWSYMFWFRSKQYKEHWPPALFDLRRDPEERNNVAREYPEIANALELELRKFVEGLE